MKTFLVVALTALVAVSTEGAAVTNANTTGHQDRAPWYNCGGRVGNFRHPTECTYYIACAAGNIAYEMGCAECHRGDANCIVGSDGTDRTVYNEAQDKCLWNYETECRNGDGETTTDGPTTDGTTDSGTITSTTEKPDDNSCNPEDCKHDGQCDEYRTCQADRTWSAWKKCGSGFFFNPRVNSETGGQCVLWKNLPSDLQTKYLDEEECLKCWWKEKETCGNKFSYKRKFDPAKPINPPVVDMDCSEDTIFDPIEKICVSCWNAKTETGESCSDIIVCPAPITSV